MKRTWKVEVLMEEELEGWSKEDQLTSVDIEGYVSEAVIRQVKEIEGVDFVECEAEEEEEDEETLES